MKKESKIFIAGHNGMIGSAICRTLIAKGYSNIVGKSIDDVDLTNQNETAKAFAGEKPEYVILAAAKVGGIGANNKYRAQFIYENLQIQNNVIHSSYINGVKKLLFLGSSCIYPKNALNPIKEEYLLTDVLEYTNEPYAVAKIAGIKMCDSYNLQYGTNFISVMPTNSYGFNDNYDLEKSHVLPALLRKMHIGKCLMQNNINAVRNDLNKYPIEGIDGNASNNDIENILGKYGIFKTNDGVNITLWGTGMPRREFILSDDMADACVFIMENVDFNDIVKLGINNNEIRNTHINIGSGIDYTIAEIAEIVKRAIGFEGEILWNKEIPDGTPKKLLDSSRLKSLGWQSKISLEDGLKKVYSEYSK